MDQQQALVLEDVKHAINETLQSYYSQWNTGMSYRMLFTKYAKRFSTAGVRIDSFISYLRSERILIECYSPKGSRYYFPANLTDSPDSLLIKLMDLDALQTEQNAQRAAIRKAKA